MLETEVRELSRRWAEAIQQGRVPKEILAPGYTMENVVTAMTERSYAGAEGVEQWLADIFSVFAEGYRYEVDVVDFRDDRILTRITISGTGRASGAPLDLSHWAVVWFADGKVTRAVGYPHKRDAVADGFGPQPSA